MIVKNEEEVLARCLESVRGIVDEVIIIDTGSTDKTKEIALSFTEHVYDFEWCDDFSAARNYSFSKATCEYIMWLDADDYITPEEQTRLLILKRNFDNNIDVAFLKYNIAFDSNGAVTCSNYRERILKRSMNFEWAEPVHECITPRGEIRRFDIAITHGDKARTHNTRNLDIYEKQLELTNRGRFYYARELKEHHRYQEAIAQHEQFLTDGTGGVENNIRACHDLFDCFNETNEQKTAVKYLFETFLYDKPRAEACYKLGNYFFTQNNYEQATFWHLLALNPSSHHEGGFFNRDYCDFLPSLQMCIITWRLKNYDLSYKYHLQTKVIKPNHQSVKYNDEYFKNNYLNQKLSTTVDDQKINERTNVDE